MPARDRAGVAVDAPPPSWGMPVPPPPRSAARLDDAVLRCLAADPADRFASAADLRAALEAADPTASAAASPTAAALHRTGFVLALGGAAAVALLPVAYGLGRRGWPPWGPPASASPAAQASGPRDRGRYAVAGTGGPARDARPAVMPPGPQYVDRALADLLGPDPSRRQAAIASLRRADASLVAPARRAAVAQALRQVAAGTDVWPAHNAITALGVWGSTADVPFLGRALDNRDGLLRRNAIEALGRIGGPAAADLLVRRLEVPADKGSAARALAAVGPAAEPAVLHRYAQAGGDLALRLDLLALLEAVGTPAAEPQLQTATDDPEPAVRAAARRALGAVRSRGAR